MKDICLSSLRVHGLCHVKSEQPAEWIASSVHLSVVPNGLCCRQHYFQNGPRHQYMKDLFVVTKDMWFVPCEVWIACRVDCTVSTWGTCLWSLMVCGFVPCEVRTACGADCIVSTWRTCLWSCTCHGSLRVCGLCSARSEQPAERTAPSVPKGPVCGPLWFVLCAMLGWNSLQIRLHRQYMKGLFMELCLVVPYDLCFVPCQDWATCRSDCTISTWRTCLWSCAWRCTSWVTNGMWFVPHQVWTACRVDCTASTWRTCLWSCAWRCLWDSAPCCPTCPSSWTRSSPLSTARRLWSAR